MSANADRLIVADAEPDAFAFCTWKNVTISVWWLQATGPAVERANAVARGVLPTFPDGISSIHIVKEGALLPDAEGRTALMKLIKDFESDVACAAVVVGGSGFWASALRAAITGVWLAAASPMELKMMGTFEEVAAWLPPKHQVRTGVQLDPGELVQMLAQADARELTHPSTLRSA